MGESAPASLSDASICHFISLYFTLSPVAHLSSPTSWQDVVTLPAISGNILYHHAANGSKPKAY